MVGLISVITLILPEKIAGQWTTYGEEYDAKWKNFKKYIQFSYPIIGSMLSEIS